MQHKLKDSNWKTGKCLKLYRQHLSSPIPYSIYHNPHFKQKVLLLSPNEIQCLASWLSSMLAVLLSDLFYSISPFNLPFTHNWSFCLRSSLYWSCCSSNNLCVMYAFWFDLSWVELSWFTLPGNLHIISIHIWIKK